MFIPGGCFCCEPPADPCNSTNCTWTATTMDNDEVEAYDTVVDTASWGGGSGTFTITNVQDTATGNNLPCRKISVNTTVAPTAAVEVYAVCWKKSATHNPSSQCPLTNVVMCVESKRHSDSGQSSYPVYFFIRQGGLIYRTTTAGSMITNWKRFGGTFTSSQFTGINFNGAPNFTSAGSSLEFGFGYKVAVASGATEYAEVRFDNFCITPTKNCVIANTCNTSVCDITNTGQLLAIDDSSTSALYSIENTIGAPSPCHKFTTGEQTELGFVQLVISSDLFDSSVECRAPSSVSLCLNFLNPTHAKGIVVTFRQGSLIESIGYTAYIDNVAWQKINTTANIGSNFLQNFDFSQPVEMLLRVQTNVSPTIPTVTYIDNICVKVGYGCPSLPKVVSVSFSGVTVSTDSCITPYPVYCNGCTSQIASDMQSFINSTTFILNRPGSLCEYVGSFREKTNFAFASGQIAIRATTSSDGSTVTGLIASCAFSAIAPPAAISVDRTGTFLFANPTIDCTSGAVSSSCVSGPSPGSHHCFTVDFSGSTATVEIS